MNKIQREDVLINSEGSLVLNELKKDVYNISANSILILNLSDFKFNKCEFNLDDNSYLIINKSYNEKYLEEEIVINLNGFNSRVDYNFSTLTYDDQKFVININHNNQNTISNIVNHGVVMNEAKLVFEVNSTVKKGNKNSKLNQTSKIITMSSNNSIIKPNLFIDEYDVDAFHSATIGKFSDDEIFYLMTKGLSQEDAVNLLIKGFLSLDVRR